MDLFATKPNCETNDSVFTLSLFLEITQPISQSQSRLLISWNCLLTANQTYTKSNLLPKKDSLKPKQTLVVVAKLLKLALFQKRVSSKVSFGSLRRHLKLKLLCSSNLGKCLAPSLVSPK
jgi:hypothetical protein